MGERASSLHEPGDDEARLLRQVVGLRRTTSGETSPLNTTHWIVPVPSRTCEEVELPAGALVVEPAVEGRSPCPRAGRCRRRGRAGTCACGSLAFCVRARKGAAHYSRRSPPGRGANRGGAASRPQEGRTKAGLDAPVISPAPMAMNERYEPQSIEPRWQTRWEEAGVFRPAAGPARRRSTCSRCSRTPAARCTWGTCATTSSATSTRATSGCAASTCCTPWAGTPSGCPRRTRPSRTACTRPCAPRENIESLPGRDEARSATPTTGRARSTPASPSTTAGTSGSSSRCSSAGIVYRRFSKVNWCTGCLTVIANEQVKDGALRALRLAGAWTRRCPSGRSASPRYARGRCSTGWTGSPSGPSASPPMQRNWIGRREGAEVGLRGRRAATRRIRVFTTRVDTIYGCTYVVLAPEHPLVAQRDHAEQQRRGATPSSSGWRQTEAVERTGEGAAKEGVFTGAVRDEPVHRRAGARSGSPTSCSPTTARAR